MWHCYNWLTDVIRRRDVGTTGTVSHGLMFNHEDDEVTLSQAGGQLRSISPPPIPGAATWSLKPRPVQMCPISMATQERGGLSQTCTYKHAVTHSHMWARFLGILAVGKFTLNSVCETRDNWHHGLVEAEVAVKCSNSDESKNNNNKSKLAYWSSRSLIYREV